MPFPIFYFAFLALQLQASIIFFKEVTIGSNIKLLDGGNATLTYVDVNDNFHIEKVMGEELQHSSTESIGFNASRIKQINKKRHKYPNDFYIVWGDEDASFFEI